MSPNDGRDTIAIPWQVVAVVSFALGMLEGMWWARVRRPQLEAEGVIPPGPWRFVYGDGREPAPYRPPTAGS